MAQYYAQVVWSENPTDFQIENSAEIELCRISKESIGIDDIRTVIIEAHRRPQEGFSSKSIVLSGLKITSEAQQAALKILEETPENISLTFVFPPGTQLLDTISSRVQFVEEVQSLRSDSFKVWLNRSHKDRLTELESKLKEKDSVWMQEMKSGLQAYCREASNLDAKQLRELQLVMDNILTRGASNKMLLEHLALTLPLTR